MRLFLRFRVQKHQIKAFSLAFGTTYIPKRKLSWSGVVFFRKKNHWFGFRIHFLNSITLLKIFTTEASFLRARCVIFEAVVVITIKMNP